jgi:hypothetical protein
MLEELFCELSEEYQVKCSTPSTDGLTWSGCQVFDNFFGLDRIPFSQKMDAKCFVTGGSWMSCYLEREQVKCQRMTQPAYEEIRCQWGEMLFSNCSHATSRWNCQGDLSLISGYGLCWTNSGKWGFCNDRLQCSWDGELKNFPFRLKS